MKLPDTSASNDYGNGLRLLYFVGIVSVAILGALTAIAPSLVARLTPFLLLIVIVLVGLMSRSSDLIGETFREIWLALSLFVFALWPSYMFFKYGAFPAVDARKLASGLSIAVFAYLWVSRVNAFRSLCQNSTVHWRTAIMLILALIAWQLFASITSKSPIASIILVVWDIANYYFFFILGVLVFRGERLEHRFVSVLFTVSSMIFVFAIAEWVVGKNILVAIAPRNEAFAEFNAMLAIERARDGFFRAQGTFEHPLVLAEYSAMVACFCMAAVVFPGTRARRLAGFLTLTLAVLSAWLSGSRSAFIAIGLGLTVVVLLAVFHSKKHVGVAAGSMRKVLFIFSLCGVAALAVPVGIQLSQGKSISESSSTEGRIYMLRVGVPSVLENPILGLGPGAAGSVASIKTGAGITTLDNHLLAIAIDTGLIGLLLYLATLICPAWMAINRLTRGAGSSSMFLAGGVGAVAAFIVTRSILSIPYNQVFAFLIAGMMVSATSRIAGEEVLDER